MKIGTAICVVGLAAIGAFLVVMGHGDFVAGTAAIAVFAAIVLL